MVQLDTLLAARTLWHAGRSAAIAADGEPTGHAALDALLPQGGWPRRALTELLLPADGVGELSLLLPTLARCTREGERVVLVAPPYLPYAPAWQAAGVELSQLRIVEAAPRDALWAFEQCLRSGTCAAVIGWPQQADARALRRLQVAADTGQCLGFALRDRRHLANPSPAALRLEAVRAGRGMAWQVRKCRGGPVPAQPFLVEAEASSRSGAVLREQEKTGPAPVPVQAPVREVATLSELRLANVAVSAGKGGAGWSATGAEVASRAPAVVVSTGCIPAPGTAQPMRDPGMGQSMRDTAPALVRVAADPPMRRLAAAPTSAGGGGPGWKQADRDAAARAGGARPSAFGTSLRGRGMEAPVRGSAPSAASHPQHELQFAPAALVRD